MVGEPRLVVDASAVLELLLNTPRAAAVAASLRGARSLHAPHLLDLEVVQVLRRFVLRGDLAEARARAALRDLGDLDLARYEHAPFARRLWALRETATAYDAAYLALAEALDAPLLTCDARLGRSHGHQARVQVV